MRGQKVLTSVMGLVLLAGAAYADIPKEITLLGKKYAVEAQSRVQTYKNGLKVSVDPDATVQTASIDFAQGETADKDRLFVGTNPDPTDDLKVDQLYVLEGTDENGRFTPAATSLKQFWGGAIDWNKGGRVATITWISDDNTGGVKKDRNLVISTFSNDDYLRFYDLDSLNGDYLSDSLLDIVQRVILPDEGQAGMPYGGFVTGARTGQKNILLFAGRGEGSGPQLSVMDVTKDTFFDVITNLTTATEKEKVVFDVADDVQDFEQLSGNEYLMITAQPSQKGGPKNYEKLWHLRITPPADLATAKPESIKVEVLGMQEITNADTSIDLFGNELTGIENIAVGRGGRLYIATTDAMLLTLQPL